jgi:hypothetical protein
MLQQKIEYLHYNPVRTGVVEQAGRMGLLQRQRLRGGERPYGVGRISLAVANQRFAG